MYGVYRLFHHSLALPKMEGHNFSFSTSVKVIFSALLMILDHIRWIIARFSTRHIDTHTCLVGKTAIITGGNSGIGFATSTLLASRGCKIIIASNVECEADRLKLIESTKNPNITTKYLDLGSFDSIRQFAEDIKKNETKIDFLINNAGVGIIQETLSKDGLNNAMQINYLGHFLLTHLLIDELKAAASSRVVFVSSSAAYFNLMAAHEVNQMPKIENKPTAFEMLQFYCNSKLCQMIAAQEFGKKLNKYGIIANSVDPGVIHTHLIQGALMVNTADIRIKSTLQWIFRYLVIAFGTDVYSAAKNTVFALTGENVTTGGHYFQCNPVNKHHTLNNAKFCGKIWAESEVLVGLTSEEKLT